MDGLRHPGPRPDVFEFPFAQAAAALTAVDDTTAELRGMVSAHEDAVVGARVDFEGETRVSFDQGFAQLMGETDGGIRQLEAQRDDLEDEVAEARRRRDASLDAIADWSQAMRWYTEDRAGQPS